MLYEVITITSLFSTFKKFLKKLTKNIYTQSKNFIRFIKRRIKGIYNANEMIKLQNMPYQKLSKRQKLALDKHNESMKKYAVDISKLQEELSRSTVYVNKMINHSLPRK